MRPIGAAIFVLLGACSQQAESQVPINEAPAVVAESVHVVPSAPSDPLDEAALREQRALLQANDAKATSIYTERDARLAIYGRINVKFRDAVTELRQAGVSFDKAEYAVNILNVDRRRQGVFELQTTYQDADDRFRIVDDFMSNRPSGIVLLKGTDHPQSFGGWIRGEIVDAGGGISKACRVAFPSGSDEKSLGCRAVVTGKEDATLTDLAKAYLTSEMR